MTKMASEVRIKDTRQFRTLEAGAGSAAPYKIEKWCVPLLSERRSAWTRSSPRFAFLRSRRQDRNHRGSDIVNLELMRLSLWPRGDVNARHAKGPDGKPILREDWLREVFSTKLEFDYRGQKFFYVPTLDEIEAPFVAGRIGLLSRVRENEPPEAGLEDTVRDRWKAIIVLLDPRSHKDGQKVAVEFGTGVAKPLPIFTALIRHINHIRPPTPYSLEVKAISPEVSFWDFVARNEGEVTSVTFEFLAPNMFGIEDDMDKEANDLKRFEKAKKAAITIESDSGLDLKTDRVERTVNYTSRGGGSIKASAKHDHFNSNDTAQRVRVPEEPIGTDQAPRSLRSRIARAIRVVFGHD